MILYLHVEKLSNNRTGYASGTLGKKNFRLGQDGLAYGNVIFVILCRNTLNKRQQLLQAKRYIGLYVCFQES
jgi:hypothetical protein